MKVSICEYNPNDGKKQNNFFRKSFIQLYGVTVRTTRHSEKGIEETNIYHWLVLNKLGTTNLN